MQLNHLNLQVSDAAQCADFLANHFGVQTVLEKPDRTLIAMRADNFDLVLQQTDEAATYPSGFHFGFIVASTAALHEQYRHLLAIGLPGIGSIERSRRGEQFFVKGPCGLTIELACHQVELS